MQHVHVVLRDEASDVRVAVRSRNVAQVLPLSWGQRGVLRSRVRGGMSGNIRDAASYMTPTADRQTGLTCPSADCGFGGHQPAVP